MIMTSVPRPDDPKRVTPHDETIVTNTASGSGVGGSGSGSRPKTGFFSSFHGSGTAPRTVEEFTQQLTASGLMTAEELLSFYDSVDLHDPVVEVEKLIEMLVEHRRLTPYQAESVALGQTRGLVLGNYVILDKLGEGGMGMVFKARHRLMKRIVALKVLPPSMTQSADAVSRFHREVEAAAKLQHANIAGAYDADQADGIHFLVMEHVDGPNLSSLVKEIGPLAPPLAMNIISQAARGLAHAHANGVVHRDIKPGNLLVNPDGVVKILDMGLAQLQSNEENSGAKADLTQSGRIMGTVDYMAPEQALDAKTVDQRADIYSLGCTLYYLLAGRSMSPDGTLTQKLLWHQSEPIPSLREVCPAAPEQLEEVFRNMVAKKPAERYSTMVELLSALEPLLADIPDEQLQLPTTGVGLSNDPGSSTDYNRRHGKVTMVDRRTQEDLGATIDSSRDVRSPLAARPAPSKFVPLMLALALLGIAAGVGLFLLIGPALRNDPDSPAVKNGGANGELATLIVAANQPNARVIIDGKIVGATNGTQPYELTHELPPGEHTVKVELDGYRAIEKTVTLQRSAPFTLNAALAALPGMLEIAVDIPGVQVSIDEQAKGSPIIDKGDYRLALQLEPGEYKVKLAAEGYVTKMQTVTVASGQTFPLKTTLVERPYRELLTWLFANAHPKVMDPVVLVTSQRPVPASRWVNVPDDYTEIAEIRLDNATVGNGDAPLLATARALESLSLANTQIGDEGVKALQTLTTLRKLNLAGTRITSKALSYLGEMQQLTDLDLRQTTITDASMLSVADLPKLERLHLSETEISDEGIAHLAKLQTLRTLSVDGARVTEAGYHRLGESFEKNPINKADLDPEQGLARKLLRSGATIAIRKAASVAEEPTEVTDIDRLPTTKFHIVGVMNRQSREIDDELVAQFKNLSQLAELDLDGSAVTDEGVEHLREIKTLRKVNLGYLRLAKSSVDELEQLLPEGEVIWHGPRDRAAAEWVLSQGGKVRIHASESQFVADLESLPDRDFTLEEIHLVNLPDFDEAELAVLKDLSGLKRLYLGGTKITTSGLMHITGCRQVEQLVLSGKQVETDVLPVIVSQFPSLRQLFLADTAINGVNLNLLKKLPELRQLSLAGTNVKDADLAALAGLPNLMWLSLDGASVTDAAIPHLAKLAKLKVLSLDDRLVDDEQMMMDRNVLPELPDRRPMQMTDAGLEELASLLKGTTLYHRELDPERLAAKWVLSRKGVVLVEAGEPKPIRVESAASLPRSACRVLQVTLKSGSCKPEEIASALRSCRHLQTLDLSGFEELRSKHVEALAGLSSLLALNLSKTGVNDDVFAHLGSLKQLRWLYLDSTFVSGDTLGDYPLPSLTHFSAEASDWSDAGMQHLAKCTNLTMLRLGICKAISEKGFAPLEGLTNLQELNLWQTRITDASGAAVAKLSKLRTLRLTGTAIGDSFITQLKEMPDLATIELANTKVTDASLAHLAGFPSLKSITSYGTAVTDAGAKPLSEKGINVIKSADAAERDPNAAPGRFGP